MMRRTKPYNIDEATWYDDEAWDMNTKRYASLITHMDRAIGRLLAELDRLGLREKYFSHLCIGFA